LPNIVVAVHEIIIFSVIGSLFFYGRETTSFNVYILLHVVHT